MTVKTKCFFLTPPWGMLLLLWLIGILGVDGCRMFLKKEAGVKLGLEEPMLREEVNTEVCKSLYNKVLNTRMSHEISYSHVEKEVRIVE